MARKSNKTAHVLNLIAGHDGQQETTEENRGSTEAASSASAPAAPSAPAPAVSAAPQNISVIDTTTEDPVADLIQQQLTNQFDEPEKEDPKTESESVQEDAPQSEPVQEPAPVQQAVTPSETVQEHATQPETVQEPAAQPEPVQEPAPVQQAVTPSETVQEPAAQPETVQEPAAQPEPAKEAAPQSEPEIALEPDFARVNVMEAIVNDKIIYFMRQFDVCTCDRCVADTCALTLSGLLPKYIVTTPAAVDPLLSFYTNRYISDVTVEATKACMIVKDNPRH